MDLTELPATAMQNIGAHLRLRDVAKVKVALGSRENALLRADRAGGATSSSGALADGAATALLKRRRRSDVDFPAPYLYKYEPVYDPNVPEPGNAVAGAAGPPGGRGYNFDKVQALDFQNTRHSNASFPQQWTRAGQIRLAAVLASGSGSGERGGRESSQNNETDQTSKPFLAQVALLIYLTDDDFRWSGCSPSSFTPHCFNPAR